MFIIGLKSNFIIIDSDDQVKLIKQICERERIDIKEKTPKYFATIINNYKNKAINPESIKKNVFQDNGDKLGISKIAYNFLGGVMRLAQPLSSFFNPSIIF